MTTDERTTENDYTCGHGLLVGLDDTNDPRECQVCDWCPRCEGVRMWDAHGRCVACRRAWGADEDCHADPCRCGR